MRRYAIGIVIFLGTYLVLILLYIYPHWPVDLVGWLVLILIGVPISFCLEWISESAFSKKTGVRISTNRLSVTRIAIALLFIVLIAGTFALLWAACGPFIRPHFN
jgi:hypothetical protein